MSRYMRAMPVAMILAGIGLAVAVGLGATSRPGSPALSPEELRQKAIAFAGGPDALASIHSFSYDFVIGTDPKAMMIHHHAYDADKKLYRYETPLAVFAKTNFWKNDHWTTDPNVPIGKTLVAIYSYPRLEGTVYIDGKPLSGDENMRLLRRVNDSVENDRYFAFLPLIVNNPMIHVDPAPPVTDAKYGPLQGFTAWSGSDKAKNKTLWTLYLTPKGEFVRTDIVVLNGAGPVIVYWEKWKQFGPVRIAQEKVVPKMNRSFFHRNIIINRPVEIEPPRS